MAEINPPIRRVEYVDTEGNKHTIEERWHIVTYFVNGNSGGNQKSPKTDFYIDGKLWVGFDETATVNPFVQAEGRIEEQVRERNQERIEASLREPKPL